MSWKPYFAAKSEKYRSNRSSLYVKPAEVDSPAPAPMTTASASSSARRRRAICAEKPLVDRFVEILENIENHLYFTARLHLIARTVSTAISAARSFGKWNTPVEMQQNAMLRTLFFSASSRQDR